MNKLVFCLLFPLIALANSDTAGPLTPVKLLTVDYCPLVCQDGTGLAIDITKKIAKEAKVPIEIHKASMTRAFGLLKTSSDFHGMILGGKDHVPNSIFMNRPIFTQRVKIFSRKSLNWEYRGVKSLENKRIAIIKNFSYANRELNEFLKSDPNVVKLFHSDSLPKLIKMLDLNRIDIFIAGDIMARHHLKKQNMLHKFKVSQLFIGSYDNYISFSKNYPKREMIKKKFDRAFEKLIKTKKLGPIQDL
ncbi:ABC transporter substrate-binding protein [Bacteriovorax sp. DB6_IX]|uniref:substrate-binding periplasmic protein n=1 Tax=Bacteriovorax sp. DB6_IX TaxID=1353530 RepID=UPI00038A0CA3|nr:transporter substrate-binding domain-containing protein [Bacteriovorax sp. DB6_IX]EQC52337.1 ABC transporter, substrate-binding protein, family 3 [Bacteriovorax sp. DB6_IX]